MFEPMPQRTSVICLITVFGSTPSASFMKVPFGSGSAIGPKDIADRRTGQHELRRSRADIDFPSKDRCRLRQYAAKSCARSPRIGRRRLDSAVEAVMLPAVDQHDRI